MKRNTQAVPLQSNKARIAGCFMSILGIILVIVFSIEYVKERVNVKSFPDSINEADAFVDVHTFGRGISYSMFFISLGVMLMVWGGYRIVRKVKATNTVNLIALGITASLFIGLYTPIHMENKIIKDELISAQHEWAEKRYGIEYDDITTKSWTTRLSKKNYAQDKVMKDGQVIATACTSYPLGVIFCEPGTTNELPLVYIKQQ